MIYYPNKDYKTMQLNKNDRFIGPFLPFLGGALIGGAAVGLTRPRPIYNVAPVNYPYYPYPYGPYNTYNNYYNNPYGPY